MVTMTMMIIMTIVIILDHLKTIVCFLFSLVYNIKNTSIWMQPFAMVYHC